MHPVSFLISFAIAASALTPVWAQTRPGGFVEYDNLTYFETGSEGQVNGRNQMILFGQLQHALGARADAYGAVEIRYDEAAASRNRIYLDEAYINLHFGPLDVRLGKQIYAWGRADAFNPTDFSSWDFSDILDTEDEKLGMVSLRVTYYVGNWSLQAVAAPSFTPSTLPEPESRWWPELPSTVENPAYPAFGPPLLPAEYRFLEPARPVQTLSSAQYGLRAAGTLSGWDFSISWFDGFDDLPAIHVTPEFDASLSAVRMIVEPRDHRRRTVGADFATILDGFGLRGEAAYYLTADPNGTDPAIDDPYVHYVIGADRTLDRAAWGKDIFLLAEWMHEIRIPARTAVFRSTDLNHLFRKSVFGKADVKLDDFSTLSLQALFNVETKDWYVQPGGVWSIADGLKLRGGLDLLGGPNDAFFGLFSSNRRVHLRLQYHY